MAGEIASAYVRIRPQMSGFRSETESGVRSGFANIGKIVGGAFAAVGAFEFGKHIVEQASGQQAAFAVLDKAISNVGASTRGFGDDLESVLAKEARLKGFSDEQLAAGLTQLVSVTHNTKKAFADLGIAEDLARARHKDLTVASLALARAEQGSTTTLSRFGIKVPEVTAAVDKLKKAHDEAVIGGAKFTGQAKLEYEALLAQAKSADKAATKTEALRLVQERFGGVASTFAESSAGEFARFHENISQLEIAIGKGLLPGLSGAAAGLNKYISELATSEGIQNVVRDGAHEIGQAFGVFKSIVETIGPPLLTVAHGAQEVTKAIGVAPIIGAVVAYKGLISVIGKAAELEKAYAATVELGRAKKLADAASSGTQVGFFSRLNGSLKTASASRVKDAEAANVQAASLTKLTESLAANTAALTANESVLASRGIASLGADLESAGAGVGLATARVRSLQASLSEAEASVVRARAGLSAPIIVGLGADPAPLNAALAAALAETERARAELAAPALLELGANDAPLLEALAAAETSVADARRLLASPLYATATANIAPLEASLAAAQAEYERVRVALAVPLSSTATLNDLELRAGLADGEAAVARARAALAPPLETTLVASPAPLLATLATAEAAVADSRTRLAAGGTVVLSGDDAPLLASLASAEAAVAQARAQLASPLLLTGDAAPLTAALAQAQGAIAETRARLADPVTAVTVADTAPLYAALAEAEVAVARARVELAAPLLVTVGADLRPLTTELAGLDAASGSANGHVVGLTAAFEANAAAARTDAAATEGLIAIYGPLGDVLATVTVEADGAALALGRLGASEVGAGIAAVGTDATAAAGGLEALTVAETEAAVAGEAAAAGGLGAFAAGIGRLGLGAVGGPVGAAVIGIAALAGGVVYLATRESQADAATKKLSKSIADLGSAQESSRRSSLDLAEARNGLQSDRVAVGQARLNVETARHALATSGAAKGTAEYQRLVLGLEGALASYHQAQTQVNDDLFRFQQAQEAATKQTAATKKAMQTVTDAADGLRLAERRAALEADHPFVDRLGKNGLDRFALSTAEATRLVDQFTGRLQRQIPALEQQSPLIAHNTQLLIDFARQIGGIPTKKETQIILSTPNLSATLADVDAKLKSLDPQAYADGQAIGVAWGQGILAGIHGVTQSPLAGVIKGFEGPLAGVSKGIQAKVRAAFASGVFTPAQIAKQFGITSAQVVAIEKAATAAAEKAADAAKRAHDRQLAKPKDISNVIPFKVQLELAAASTPAAQRHALEDEIAALNRELSENITESSRRAILLERASAQVQLDGLAATVAQGGSNVANTIHTANQAIAKSISDAKSNLDSIGAKLGDSIDKFLKKTGAGAGGLDTAQTAAFQKLKDLIRSGGTPADIERAGQQLASQINAKAAAPAGTSAKDQIKGLEDSFNSGKIGLKAFNRKIADLLKSDHVSYAEAGKVLGKAFEDGLRAQVTGLRGQAAAIAAVPPRLRGAGGQGDVIKIIRPLEVIQRENALIRSANDRHAAEASRQRERIIRAQERAAKAAEKTAAAVTANQAAKKMLTGASSAKAKKAAGAGVRP